MKQRHAFTTFGLVTSMVYSAFAFYTMMNTYIPLTDSSTILFSITVPTAKIINTFYILKWKKGFYQSIIGTIALAFHWSKVNKSSSELDYIIIASFAEIALFIFVMNLKSKNGKTCLEQLE